MMDYKKPQRWAQTKNELFPYRVGFTAPPHDFDAAPSDFLRIAPEGMSQGSRASVDEQSQ